MKDGDSSKKQVYHCELCDKWFCETHSKPKFPYFIDWDTIFDVQGNPEIKALFHIEYKREGGHPDFVYWRKTIEALDLEEKTRNELIRQAMDRMMHPEKYGIEPHSEFETDKTKRVEMLIREEMELTEQTEVKHGGDIYPKYGESTRTYNNVYHHDFEVPSEVYAVEEYRDRLNTARTLEEVERIIDDYNKHHRKEQESSKKKHW